MPANKKSRNKIITNGNDSSGPVTRSKRSIDNIDITTYTKLNDSKSKQNPIQVVSKRGLKPNPKHYEELEKSFERIEAKRKLKEENEANGVEIDSLPINPEVWKKRSIIFAVTHFNVFLYAMCFFIQVSTLPVSLRSLICWALVGLEPCKGIELIL